MIYHNEYLGIHFLIRKCNACEKLVFSLMELEWGITSIKHTIPI